MYTLYNVDIVYGNYYNGGTEGDDGYVNGTGNNGKKRMEFCLR